ncbi:MAG: hypothetical protein P1V51_08340 [Deltaproteobacteria bacterium]|nr:hypothetical protein [Deltaproteobacteria bacterium]
MARHDFQVRPLERYEGARYHSVHLQRAADAAAVELSRPVPVPERRRPSLMELVRIASMTILVFTLSMAMVACYSENDDDHQQQWISDGGSDGGDDTDGGDITAGVMAECTPGDVYCSDAQTLQTCTDGYWYEAVDCNTWCQETYGPEYGQAWSNGCDADAAEPCQCQYDMVAGEMVQCLPGDIYCSDPGTAQVCNEDQMTYSAIDCATHCEQTHGPSFGTTGCDESDPENFCGCTEFVPPKG